MAGLRLVLLDAMHEPLGGKALNYAVRGDE